MRKGLLRLSLLGLALASACAGDSSPQSPTTIGTDGSRIHRSDDGPLTAPSTARAEDVVRGFLGGYVDVTDQMRLTGTARGLDGVMHLRFEQESHGLRVHGAYVRAAITSRGELVQVIENLATSSAAPKPASIKHADALTAAMQRLGYDFATPAQVSGAGNRLGFARGSEFFREPSVERVAYVDGGVLKQGFLVETWSGRGNQLDYTLVGGNGTIISTERRTNNDRYNVFSRDPDASAQTIVTGAGWVSAGTHKTQYIQGPAVRAYIDADANNQPDGGGTSVTNGDFLTAADLASAPTTEANKNVAVQNLFYLNNVLHDRLAAVGFSAANGENNFENDDPVLAEAQDGSGTDNANMSTPTTGSPRMQMYLWTGRTPTVKVNGTIGGYQSSFGPAFTTTATTGAIARTTPADGCTAIAGSLAGKIALIARGNCAFVDKVRNAQNAGATAVLIANDSGSAPFAPGGTDRKIKIPSAMISQTDGAALTGSASIVKYTGPAALMRDGDVDSDIVFHEYGHGLTWRMVGSMSGPLSGAIGEGASDTLAFLLNDHGTSGEDGAIGEYSYSDPWGIRRNPYDAYGLTYKAVDGGEVHNDGELYAAAMFRTLQNYKAAGLTAQDLLADWVNSLHYIAPSPSYESMRDGLVTHVSTERVCYVWRAFASLGIGEGSSSQLVFSKGKYTVKVTEMFTVPTGC